MRTEDRGPVSPSVFVSCDNSLQEDFGLSNLKLSQEKKNDNNYGHTIDNHVIV